VKLLVGSELSISFSWFVRIHKIPVPITPESSLPNKWRKTLEEWQIQVLMKYSQRNWGKQVAIFFSNLKILHS